MDRRLFLQKAAMLAAAYGLPGATLAAPGQHAPLEKSSGPLIDALEESCETNVLSVKKGRILLKAGYAHAGENLVVTAGPGGCALLFREEEWQPFEEKLRSAAGPLANELRRLMLGLAFDVVVNRRRTIQIDNILLNVFNINDTILWVSTKCGVVELWNPDSYGLSDKRGDICKLIQS